MRLTSALPRSAAALHRWLLAAGAVPVLFAATTSGDLGRGAAATLGLAGLAAAAVALHRHHGKQLAPATLAILERQPLGRDAGVALVTAGGRRLVIGWGTAGVTLLAKLPRGGREVAP